MLPIERNLDAVSKDSFKKAAFFDRDGIINVNHGYVHTIDQFDFMDGIIDVMIHVQSLGFQVVVVTNQSGIARGMYTEDDFLILNHWMCTQLNELGVHVTQTYYCPHHPSAGEGAYTQDCLCRKPKPGMLIQAAEDHDFNLELSILVGDNRTDMECAIAAKLHSGFWLTSSLENEAAGHILSQNSNYTALHLISELTECLHLICEN